MDFIITNILLGIGLAMDAFSVSIANGLYEPGMSGKRRFMIAGTYGVFQFIMPLIGWICVTTLAEAFISFQKVIPWIALALLLIIGIKMVIESLKNDYEHMEYKAGPDLRELMVQGIATSLDALSVGFTIAAYDPIHATAASLIIGVVTFGICITGLVIGNRVGMKVTRISGIIGGIILIVIGTEIFVRGVIVG